MKFISQITLFVILISHYSAKCNPIPYIQGIHLIDPGREEFKYINSWNSDQWIEFVRKRCIANQEQRRMMEDPEPIIYGQWVNLVIVASEDEINSAFSETSERSYPEDEVRNDYFWSDVSFQVFAVVRKPNNETLINNNESREESEKVPIKFNVFNCSIKKMFLNAKIDSSNFSPISIQNLFPKRVKNPKETLRIPLGTCTKVSQTRSLIDEIKFQLGSKN